jgi:NADP-dependent 3-hydroxy acid dehydrogenase YdfG
MTTTHRPVSPVSLSGRCAVVTGAGSGIGAATARALAAAGARVAVLGRRKDRLEALAEQVGGLAVPTDVTDPAALGAAATAVRAQLGRPDLVVANAGVMLAAPFESALVPEWQEMIDVNVRGLVLTGRTFIADLLDAAADGGPADLVHIGSIASHAFFPTYGVYTATKAAVLGLTRSLRQEFGPRGVRIRVIEPGLTDTELGAGMADPQAREFLAGFRAQLQAVPASDLADVIAWTAAAPARVNAAELVVVPTRQG